MARNKPVLIAEIGCNHLGDMKVAEEMIEVLITYCKVDIIKFQKRCNRELLSEEEYNAPHPNPDNSYGKTYGEHREFLEFNLEQHEHLKNYIEDLGGEYSTSVWDVTSTKEIVSLNPNLIKIPSACNLNFKIYDTMKELEYEGEIHISLGMTTPEESIEIMEYLKKIKMIDRAVFYHCTSGYPIKHDEICLLEIEDLRILQRKFQFKDIGFSNHSKGIAQDNVAFALGATFVERHFTLDRAWRGTDHAASLEPDGMRKVVRDLNNTFAALQYKPNGHFMSCEEQQRKKLKRF